MKKSSRGIGDEGGFAPSLQKNEDGLKLLVEAIERAGYSSETQIGISLDVAATEFCMKLMGIHSMVEEIEGSELAAIYSSWVDRYPIVSIEDPFDEDDWGSWISFTKWAMISRMIGDDLYVTSPKRLQNGIEPGRFKFDIDKT